MDIKGFELLGKEWCDINFYCKFYVKYDFVVEIGVFVYN